MRKRGGYLVLGKVLVTKPVFPEAIEFLRTLGLDRRERGGPRALQGQS